MDNINGGEKELETAERLVKFYHQNPAGWKLLGTDMIVHLETGLRIQVGRPRMYRDPFKPFAADVLLPAIARIFMDALAFQKDDWIQFDFLLAAGILIEVVDHCVGVEQRRRTESNMAKLDHLTGLFDDTPEEGENG